SEEVELPKTTKVQTHQIMRFKVPIEDVDAITKLIEKTIKAQGFTESDSLTNAGDALVYLLGSK
ncbi:chromosome partitioning protein ParB, partial [Acinetobacter baumannii]